MMGALCEGVEEGMLPLMMLSTLSKMLVTLRTLSSSLRQYLNWPATDQQAITLGSFQIARILRKFAVVRSSKKGWAGLAGGVRWLGLG